MPIQHYEWKRYWLPRGALAILDLDDYLPPPEARRLQPLFDKTKSSDELAESRCLILLGEPGMGKTTELDVVARSDANTLGTSDKFIRANLGQYGSEDRLVREVFDSPDILRWVSADYTLCLMLDSLDEANIRIDTLSTLLIEKIRCLPIDRLKLRIACRSGAWTDYLERALESLYGSIVSDDGVKIYTLAPLMRADVEAAAAGRELAPGAFMAAVDARNVTPLAVRPITLRMLLTQFDRDSDLSRQKSKLYEQGCLDLCAEQNPGRNTPGLRGNLNPRQRLLIAGRIASCMVLCNRQSIWIGAADSDAASFDLCVSDICGGAEDENGNNFSITDNHVREVLQGTGLFSAAGDRRLYWSHKSYAEFLCAWYLALHGVPSRQLDYFFIHPADEKKRVIPQLQETAGWLASLDPASFSYFLARDPTVLIACDAAQLGNEQKKQLVASLLNLIETDEVYDLGLRYFREYPALVHDSIDEQLLGILNNKNSSERVRRECVDIVRVCRRTRLQKALVDIILDPATPFRLRSHALFSLVDFADAETKSLLRPLADTDLVVDERDDFKGNLLALLWPTHIDTASVLRRLHAPRDESYFGSYRSFVNYRLSKQVTGSDIVACLQWMVSERDLANDLDFDRFRESIVRAAFNEIQDPNVFSSLCRTMPSLLENGRSLDGGIPDFLNAHAEIRRNLLREIVQEVGEDDLFHLIHQPGLIQHEDAGWIIGQIDGSLPEVRSKWTTILRWIIEPPTAGDVESLIVLNAKYPEVQRKLGAMLGFIDLESETIKAERAHLRRAQQREERVKKSPPTNAQIRELAESSATDPRAAWFHICQALSMGKHWEFDPEIWGFEGWDHLSSSEIDMVRSAARSLIQNYSPTTDVLSGPNKFVKGDVAGVQALFFLAKYDPDWLNQLSSSRWAAWAEVVIAAPTNDSAESSEHWAIIGDYMFAHAAEATLHLLGLQIEHEATKGSHRVQFLHRFRDCSSQEIKEFIFNLLTLGKLPDERAAELLDWLVRQQYAPAIQYAKQLLTVENRSKAPDRATAAATSLMSFAPDGGWDEIKPYFESGDAIAEQISLAYACKYDHGDFTAKLSESELGELYVWLVRLFPHDQDIEHKGGAYSPSPRDEVADWRDGVIRALESRGTFSACAAIERIRDELPALSWLNWHRIQAEELARKKTWIPLNPSEILRLIEKPERRAVLDGSHLREIVLESIGRYQSKLKDETPATIDLWNEIDGRNQPKNEDALSNHLKRHLEADLREGRVVVNREVQIHLGERTDIHVDAYSAGSGEFVRLLKVIVEVKGCWNPELLTALDDQLVGRYLKDNSCRDGIYVVGWFLCDLWSDEDWRKSRTPSISISELEERLRKQAKGVQTDHGNVDVFVIDLRL